MTGRPSHWLIRRGGAAAVLLVVLSVVATAPVAVAGGSTAGAGDGPGHRSDAPLARQSGSLGVTATNASVPENGTTTVTITVANSGDTPSTAPVVQLGALPDGWRVVNESSPNATFRPSTREWLWVALGPGDSARVSVTVAAPANTTSGVVVPVTVTDASEKRAQTTLKITVGRQAGQVAGGEILAETPLLVAGALGVLVVTGLLALVAVVGFVLYKRSSG